MDFFEKIESIKAILKREGYLDIANDIIEAQLSGGTGGEVLMIVCSKLLGIRNRNKIAYHAIKDQADQLINYARKIGLEPIAT